MSKGKSREKRKPNPNFRGHIKVAKSRAKMNMAGAGWITVSEAAKMLKLSDRRVRDFLLSGRLPAMRLTHTWLIKKEEVIKFAQIPRSPGKPSPSI